MIWKPDTCDCVLEYNGTNSPQNFTRANRLCAAHATADAAFADNLLKNHAINTVETLVPGVKADEVAWRFDAQRKVIVTLPARVTLLQASRVALETELAKVSLRVVLE
jgi:hypothetical protein